jgi:hypothetical protein
VIADNFHVAQHRVRVIARANSGAAFGFVQFEYYLLDCRHADLVFREVLSRRAADSDRLRFLTLAM